MVIRFKPRTKISWPKPVLGELISRPQAIAYGLTRYFTGKPCPYGHVMERRTCNFECMGCKPSKVYRQNKRNLHSVKARSARLRKLHAGKIKIKKRREALRSYNLTIEQYNQMSEDQDHRCLICNKHETERDKLAVDHDHQTGLVRGLLCGLCNRNLGTYERRKTEFELYLNKHINQEQRTLGPNKTFARAGITAWLC